MSGNLFIASLFYQPHGHYRAVIRKKARYTFPAKMGDFLAQYHLLGSLRRASSAIHERQSPSGPLLNCAPADQPEALIPRDGRQPRAQSRSLVVLPDALICLPKGLVHDILGIVWVVKDIHRDAS